MVSPTPTSSYQAADLETADIPPPKRTRTGRALVTTAVGFLLTLFMMIFVLQNGSDERLEFLWLDFTLPAGVAMLLAAVVGGLIVAMLGLARVAQLKMASRRQRHGGDLLHR